MRTTKGNIWKLSRALDWVVIPTSISWRRDGTAVLGRGLAKQAAERWPNLPIDYGEQCMRHGAATPVLAHRPRGLNPRNLILFPVKPLNAAQPQLSWQQPADLELIQRSLKQLQAMIPELSGGCIYISDVGCGNGQLPLAVVRPHIEQAFKDIERVIHVRR
jgi:hypothetical protein